MKGTPLSVSSLRNARSGFVKPTGSDESGIELFLRRAFEVAKAVVDIARIVRRAFRKTRRLVPQRKVLSLFGTQSLRNVGHEPIVTQTLVKVESRGSMLSHPPTPTVILPPRPCASHRPWRRFAPARLAARAPAHAW